MKVGIVVFPGSNCDHDAWFAVCENLHHNADFIWHESADLGPVDAVILPGGFAFGDYLRCGAIAIASVAQGVFVVAVWGRLYQRQLIDTLVKVALALIFAVSVISAIALGLAAR